jgi:hypothetical protein
MYKPYFGEKPPIFLLTVCCDSSQWMVRVSSYVATTTLRDWVDESVDGFWRLPRDK